MKVEPGDILLVKNMNDDLPLDFQWNNKHHIVPPKKIGHVPFEAYCLLFGDPRSQVNEVRYVVGDRPYFIPSRESEMKRLCIYYGMYEEWGRISEVAPKVQVRTLDRETIEPVWFDPECKDVEPVNVNNQDDMRNQIHRLQQQILMLAQQANIDTGNMNIENIGEENFDDVLAMDDEQVAVPAQSTIEDIQGEMETDTPSADIAHDLPPALAGFVRRK